MLYHVTAISNVPSIRQEGICRRYSTGKAWRVWLVRADRLSWAFEHVVERHGLRYGDVCAVIVYDAGQPLRRASMEGVYWSPEDVPTHRLGDAFRLAHLPLEPGEDPACIPHTDD